MIRLRSASAAFAVCLSLVLAGCGAGIVPGSKTATTTPVANPTPLITLSLTSATFPSTTVGATSAATVVTVSNIGDATLVFSSITLGDTTNFALTNSCATSLAAKASCTISLAFKPSAAATYTSAITFTDNSSNIANSQQTIGLSGTGTVATVLAPQISIVPTSLTFADTTVGATSGAQTVTITNTGTAVLNIADITLNDLQNYSMTSTCGATLVATVSCTLTVTFHPTSTGALPSTIVLTDNANNVTNAQQTITLNGNGIAAGVPIATVTPTTLTFADTAVNSTSPALSFTLTNTGTANLIVSSLGTANAIFANTGLSCTSGTYASIAPGVTCTFFFTFTPTAAGTASLTYTLTDNSNGITGATQSVTLTGKGTSSNSSVTLAPDPLAFPDTVLNTSSASLTATLTNGGTSALTGIVSSITGGATSAAFTITGTTCGTTLAAASSCTISVKFTPFIAGTFLAYLSVADSATNSPQVISLTGTSIVAALSLNPTAIAFSTTKVGKTVTATSTLTNTGGATANLGTLTYTGDSVFTTTNTCGATLAGGASCVITVTFTPTAATSYTGSVGITSSNATPSTLTLPITGAGTNSAISYNLYELPDPGTGQPGAGLLNAVYALVQNAQKTINITIYEIQDTTFTTYLTAACTRGVRVRVILDQGHKSNNAAAYAAINAGGTNCTAVYSDSAFSNSHQKSIEVDSSIMALMSLNLQSQYYSTTRDYAMIYNDTVDIAAVEATFEKDYAVAGTSNTSILSYVPDNGNDLIWSPSNAKQKMLDVINNATTTLNVEAEELLTSASYITSAIAARCSAGVTVKVLIENQSHSYDSSLTTLKNAGCAVRQYTSSTGFYIHAKDVVADYGLPTQVVYMGSINYSNASMVLGRELGMNISDPTSVALLYNTFITDFNAAAIY